MDWKDLGPILGASAPLLGKVISLGVSFIPGVGPVAGPIIGPAIGAIVAKQFGVEPTPEAVGNAVASNPDEVVKARLIAATEEAKAHYKWMEAVELGQLHLDEVVIEQVGLTARAELAVESRFKTWWRPLNGWILAVENALIGLGLAGCLLLAMRGYPEPLKQMQDAWPLILAVLGLPAAVVGVAVWGRSIEKAEATKSFAAAIAPPSSPAPAPAKPAMVVKPRMPDRHAVG